MVAAYGRMNIPGFTLERISEQRRRAMPVFSLRDAKLQGTWYRIGAIARVDDANLAAIQLVPMSEEDVEELHDRAQFESNQPGVAAVEYVLPDGQWIDASKLQG